MIFVAFLCDLCLYKKVKLSREPKKGPRAGFRAEATYIIHSFIEDDMYF